MKEINAKSILVNSKLPESDYVINPYTGCLHGCIYCYATFMKRFTNHKEDWGKFVDVKINAADLVPKKSLKGKVVTISSVTDAYQPAERKYELTRKILKKLIPLEPSLCVLTKSDLVLRDVDLLEQFKNCVVAISMSTLDDSVRKKLEPMACSVERRLKAVEELRKNGIRVALFISPIFPKLTEWKKMIKIKADEYWFENINLKRADWNRVEEFFDEHPTRDCWDSLEAEIKKKYKTAKIYFHH
jgi:DNA repair photolyase